MSGTSRSLSPWWALLLLPAAPAVGWLVGGMPSPKSQTPMTVAQRTAVSASESPVAQGPTSGASQAPSWESAPAQGEKPKEEEEPAVVSQWTSLQIAMAESERNGKPVMIDFNADWCGPCQAMKREVFEDWKRGKAVQTAVIPVSIVDRMREEGRNSTDVENLKQRFQIDAYPTLIVFSPASGRAMRKKGFGDPDETVAWIADAAKSVR